MVCKAYIYYCNYCLSYKADTEPVLHQEIGIILKLYVIAYYIRQSYLNIQQRKQSNYRI